MKDKVSCEYIPPLVNTGEHSAVKRPLVPLPSKGESWTDEQKRWWAEMTVQEQNRNSHFETGSEPGEVD